MIVDSSLEALSALFPPCCVQERNTNKQHLYAVVLCHAWRAGCLSDEASDFLLDEMRGVLAEFSAHPEEAVKKTKFCMEEKYAEQLEASGSFFLPASHGAGDTSFRDRPFG